MAKIIVNSAPSFERGDVQDNPSHPGTNGDDIFIISPDSHGFPMANDDENRSGGKDTFRLSTDVDAKNKTPHPYQEGGGIVHIENFKIDDKIILPEEVPMNELLMLRYGYTKHPTTKKYKFDFELVHDPHDLYWRLFGRGDKRSTKFDMDLEEGKAKITGSTSRNTIWNDRSKPEPDPEHGDPRAINAKLNQLRDPTGFEKHQSSSSKFLRTLDLFLSGDYIYAADRLSDVQSTWSDKQPSLHEIMKRISTPSGTTFYEYAYGTNKQKEYSISIPNKQSKLSTRPPTSSTNDPGNQYGQPASIDLPLLLQQNNKTVEAFKKDFNFIYDQKKVVSTSMRMVQKKALEKEASLPSSKVLLI